MVGQKILLIVVISTLLFAFINDDAVIANTAMDEKGITAFLKSNPNAIIFDIRWEQLYEQGHLPGAHLIDSSLANEERYAIAEPILIRDGINYSVPIILYCNCQNGDEASYFSSYLASKGYTNTVWLKYSFSLWQNYSMLMGGPDLFGDILTAKPDYGSPAGIIIDPIIGFALLGILVVGLGAFIYYRNQQHLGEKTQEILLHAEKKQSAELDTLQKLIKEHKKVDTNKNRKKNR